MQMRIRTLGHRCYSCSFEFSESLITERVNYDPKQRLNYDIRRPHCVHVFLVWNNGTKRLLALTDRKHFNSFFSLFLHKQVNKYGLYDCTGFKQ